MKKDVEKWREDGKYLPECMRDFHDQKDLFKAIHHTIAVEGHGYAKDVSWMVGQCYVIDIFLWFMAQHGYTLQKSRANVDFLDLDKRVAWASQQREKITVKMVGQLFAPKVNIALSLMHFPVGDDPIDHVRQLGIEFEKAIHQPIADQWMFINCTNVPDELPFFMTKSAFKVVKNTEEE